MCPVAFAQEPPDGKTIKRISSSEALKDIPSGSSMPPAMARKRPKVSYICERRIQIGDKSYECDSYIDQDGEGLRRFIKDSPMAVSELNRYQSGRRSIQKAAYVGSVGFFIALSSFLYSYIFRDSQGNISNRGKLVRNIGVSSGLVILGASTTYGFISLKVNDAHLLDAVRIYNYSNSERLIELKFSRGIDLF